MKKYLFFFMGCAITLQGMHKIIPLKQKKALFTFSNRKYSLPHQYKAIPDFLDLKKIDVLQTWIDDSEKKGKLYNELYGRKGCSWNDCWLTTSQPQFIKKHSECPPITREDGSIYYPQTQSIFDCSEASHILLNDILPKAIHEMSEWCIIPQKVRTQIIVTSCKDKEENGIDWHIDPSNHEEPTTAVMLLMLNNKNHPEFGWDGGNILLKEGTPQKDNPIIATLVPRFNQAIFFKNNRYSHALTPLQPKYKNMLKRNFLYLALYTENTKNFQ